MAEPSIEQYRFKLRSASPQPAEADLFYLQTVKVERVKVDIYEAKTGEELLVSDDFRGRGCAQGLDQDSITGEEDCFIQAQYSRLPYKNLDGDNVFSATEEHLPTYIEEEEITNPFTGA